MRAWLPAPALTALAALAAVCLPAPALAGPSDGSWTLTPDSPEYPVSAIRNNGGSLTVLQPWPEGVAYETGWWTENARSGNTAQLIMRVGDLVETAQVRNVGADRMELWDEAGTHRRAVLVRNRCPLDLTYREKSAVPPSGCDWLHIKGYGYDGLEGDCTFRDDWIDMTPDMEKAPMECLITVPAAFTK